MKSTTLSGVFLSCLLNLTSGALASEKSCLGANQSTWTDCVGEARVLDTKTYGPNATYIGQFRGGVFNGLGVLTGSYLKDSQILRYVYKGEFADGLYHGIGKLRSDTPDRTNITHAEFSSGAMNGRVVLRVFSIGGEPRGLTQGIFKNSSLSISQPIEENFVSDVERIVSEVEMLVDHHQMSMLKDSASDTTEKSKATVGVVGGQTGLYDQAKKVKEEKLAKPADKVSKIAQVENNLTPLQRQALEQKNKLDAEESIRLSWKRESASYRCGIDYTFHFYRDLVTSTGLTNKYPSPPKDGEVNRYDWYEEWRASYIAGKGSLTKYDWYTVKKVGDSKVWTQSSPFGESHEFNLSTKTLFRGSQEGGRVTVTKCKEIKTK